MSEQLTIEALRKICANPYYCINIDEGLFGDHETIITKKDWVNVFTKNILEDDDGNRLPDGLIENSIKENLYRLLDVLEGNYV